MGGAAPLLEGCEVHNGLETGLWFQDGGRGKLEGCDVYANQGKPPRDSSPLPHTKGPRVDRVSLPCASFVIITIYGHRCYN
jgi:hypothetical protein